MYTIYVHKNKINGKCYVGMTKNDSPKNRWRYGYGYCHQPKFYNAIKKYGWDNFEHNIICHCLKEDVDRLEKYYIQKYDSINNGYNLDSGGCKMKTLSEATKLKISKHNAKFWKGKHLSEETRRKLSEVRTGKISPKKGKPYSNRNISEFGQYITKTKYNTFRVKIYHLKISKNFKTLKEAIIFRDTMLKERGES